LHFDPTSEHGNLKGFAAAEGPRSRIDAQNPESFGSRNWRSELGAGADFNFFYLPSAGEVRS
jgi:hypothetical protein